jgi:hypothetical protein
MTASLASATAFSESFPTDTTASSHAGAASAICADWNASLMGANRVPSQLVSSRRPDISLALTREARDVKFLA